MTMLCRRLLNNNEEESRGKKNLKIQKNSRKTANARSEKAKKAFTGIRDHCRPPIWLGLNLNLHQQKAQSLISANRAFDCPIFSCHSLGGINSVLIQGEDPALASYSEFQLPRFSDNLRRIQSLFVLLEFLFFLVSILLHELGLKLYLKSVGWKLKFCSFEFQIIKIVRSLWLIFELNRIYLVIRNVILNQFFQENLFFLKY